MRPKRQKVALAFLGSVVLHGTALLLFALIVAGRPAAPVVPPPDDEPVKMEVVEEPTPTPEPVPDLEAGATPTPTPKVIHVVDSGDAPEEATPPPDAVAQSDRNTRATNAGSPEEGEAVPTQGGRRMASFAFDPAPPPAATPPTATPPPDTAPKLPQPDRVARTPAPAVTPMPTVAPLPTAAPDEFAAIMATPPPPPEDPFDPSFRSTSPPAPQPALRPAARRTPAPVVSSAEQGNVTNRGAGNMDTAATPASRYTASACNSIRAVWQQILDAHGNMPRAGTVVVRFIINRDGQVIGPRIAGNTSDDLMANITLQAVAQTRLPPMPADATAELSGKLLPVTITFDYFPRR